MPHLYKFSLQNPGTARPGTRGGPAAAGGGMFENFLGLVL
jgi:hypothetical protein